jgi:hypothetical protein
MDVNNVMELDINEDTHLYAALMIDENTCGSLQYLGWVYTRVQDPRNSQAIHSNLPNIIHVVTKVHVILKGFAVLTWMHYTRD